VNRIGVRARQLIARFPEGVYVFATSAPKLNDKDKIAIAELALQSQFRAETESWDGRVMVLTGIELLSRVPPPYCWEDAGEPHAVYAKHFQGYQSISALCDISQQMHLGLESYVTRRNKFFEKLAPPHGEKPNA